jgi:hypothetical protein
MGRVLTRFNRLCPPHPTLETFVTRQGRVCEIVQTTVCYNCPAIPGDDCDTCGFFFEEPFERVFVLLVPSAPVETIAAHESRV